MITPITGRQPLLTTLYIHTTAAHPMAAQTQHNDMEPPLEYLCPHMYTNYLGYKVLIRHVQ